MNIVLMGYRGSGKTTIGRMMAEELWKEFIDTDALVCKRFGGMTIRQIWDEHGEAAFREAECHVVREVLGRDEQVIALGGGTVMQPEARQALEAAENTRCIYLKCDPQVLYERIAADTQTADARPALSPLGGGVQEIQQILADREPVYEALADAVFDVTHTSAADALRHLIRRCL